MRKLHENNEALIQLAEVRFARVTLRSNPFCPPFYESNERLLCRAPTPRSILLRCQL